MKKALESLDKLKSYWTLNKKDDTSKSLLESVRIKRGSLILQKVYDDHRKYFYLDNAKNLKHYDVKDQNLHEVIISDMPRRFGCDLDMEIDKLTPVYQKQSKAKLFDGSIAEFVDEIIYNVSNAIAETAKAFNKVNYKEPYVNILTRNRVDKYSAHLILTSHYLENHTQSKVFHEKMLNYVNGEYHCFIDPMTKSIQQFAIPYNFSKGHVLELKYPIGDDIHRNILDNLLTVFNLDYTHLLDGLADIAPSPIGGKVIDDISVEQCIALYREEYPEDADNHIYRDVRNGFINFDRVKGSHCIICDKSHDTDNTLCIIVNNSSAYWFCRKSKISNKQFLGILDNVVVDEDDSIDHTITKSKSDRQKKLESYVKNQTEMLRSADITYNTNYNVVEYSNAHMSSIRDDTSDILCLKGEKGLGKTKVLVDYIRHHQPKRVGYISFRRSLARSILHRFNTSGLAFKSYEDVDKRVITDDRWIVQLESLQRAEIKKLDVLIMDEVNALAAQLFSPTVVDNLGVWNRLKTFFQDAKKVIILDADMCERSFNFIDRLNSKYNKPITLHNNTFIRPYPVGITLNEKVIVSKIIDGLKAGKKICIACNKSTKYLLKLKTLILSQMKQPISCRGKSGEDKEKYIAEMTKQNAALNDRIMVYTSDTLKKPEVRATLDDIATSWKKYQVIMYSPSIQSGLSFEEEHFDQTYGLFCNITNTYDDCCQQLHRVRNCNEFYVCLMLTTYGALPLTQIEIEKWLCNNRSALFIPFEETIEYDSEGGSGRVVYEYSKKDDLYYNYIDLVLHQNQSKMQFMHRFMKRESQGGGVFTTLDAISAQDEKDIAGQMDTAAENAIREAAELSARDPEKIEFLASVYNVEKDRIDADFIIEYDDSKVREAWFNLRGVVNGLEPLRIREKTKHTTLMGKLGDRPDINQRYNYQRHMIANKILVAAGFDDVFDDNSIISMDSFVEVCLPRIKKYVAANVEEICLAFGKKKPIGIISKWVVKSCLQWTNPMLQQMYGCKINGERNENKIVIGYSLLHSLLGNIFQCSKVGKIIVDKPDISYSKAGTVDTTVVDMSDVTTDMMEFMSGNS